MFVNNSGSVTFVNEEHSQKSEPSIEFTEEGIEISVSDMHLLKELFYIVVKEDGEANFIIFDDLFIFEQRNDI